MAQDRPTLCWKCANACGGCSWSADFIPVDGWNAIPTIISANHGCGLYADIESYIVKSCPRFKDDSARYAKQKPLYCSTKVIKKRPFRAKTAKGSLRDRIWKMADREERIERLNGDSKTICELVFKFNNTINDICEYMFVSEKTARKMLNRAMEQMEAME